MGRVGLFRRLFGAEVAEVADRAERFAVDVDSGVLYGTPSLDDWVMGRARISRAEALRVPAVRRARNIIAGGIAQFPLVVRDPDGKPVGADVFPSLCYAPEYQVAPVVTWARIVEDMLLCSRGWIEATHYGWHGYPREGHRLDPEAVTVQPDQVNTRHGSALVWPNVPGLYRFDSPNGSLLDGSPAIRACILLDRATLNYVDGAPPIDYFTPTDGTDPGDEDEITAILDSWNEARKKRGTAYGPGGLTYHTGGWDPEKLQLVAAREFAILEVSRLTGIDPDDLAVAVTSRTYFNAQDRRRTRVEDVLGPYMTAIEQRLSMDDVTPPGFTATFDTASFLRLDDLSAAQSDSVLVSARILDPDEARAKRGLDPRGDDDAEDQADATARVRDALAVANALTPAALPRGNNS